MYGRGSQKLGRGGSQKLGRGRGGRRPRPSFAPQSHRPRTVPSTTASAPSRNSPVAVEEALSLVTGSPVAFAAIIRLVPGLVDVIRRVETEGGVARIKFDSIANNPAVNVIEVGGKDFRFTWSPELPDLCDIYEERVSCEDGKGLLVESGCAQRKLNVQRILDESAKNHVKMRSEEAEWKLKSRKAIVLGPADTSMKNKTKPIAAVDANPSRSDFKQRKGPPYKKCKIEPLQVVAPQKSAHKAGPSVSGKAASVVVTEKLGRKGKLKVTPADLQSMLIAVLMENPKGMSLKGLEKTIGDTVPNPVRKIEPILKKIAAFRAPGRYFLKPGVGLESLKKPSFQSGSSPEDSHLKAPPIEDNHQKAPPIEDNHQKAPPIEDNHQKAPTIEDNHQKAPPIEDNHQKAPPIEDSHNQGPASETCLAEKVSTHESEEQAPLNSKIGEDPNSVEKIVQQNLPDLFGDKNMSDNTDSDTCSPFGSSDGDSDSDSDSDSESEMAATTQPDHDNEGEIPVEGNKTFSPYHDEGEYPNIAESDSMEQTNTGKHRRVSDVKHFDEKFEHTNKSKSRCLVQPQIYGGREANFLDGSPYNISPDRVDKGPFKGFTDQMMSRTDGDENTRKSIPDSHQSGQQSVDISVRTKAAETAETPSRHDEGVGDGAFHAHDRLPMEINDNGRNKESSSDERSCPYSKYEKEDPELKGPIHDVSQYREYVHEYREKFDIYCSLNRILENYRNDFCELGRDLEVEKARDSERYSNILAQLIESYRQSGVRHKRMKKIFIVLHEELKHLKQRIKEYAVSYTKD